MICSVGIIADSIDPGMIYVLLHCMIELIVIIVHDFPRVKTSETPNKYALK